MSTVCIAREILSPPPPHAQSIEDTILKLLFESTGNILDDEKLIQTLDASKVLTSSLLLLPSTPPFPLPISETPSTPPSSSFRKLISPFLFLSFPTFHMTFLDPIPLLSSIPSSLHSSISPPPSLHPSPLLLPSSGHFRTNLQAFGRSTTDRTPDLDCKREIP